ncbi:PDDEXK nuclease domain-containing protein [Leptothoe sp. PORK10 BA2]|uniref:PDDEXK nuclease domain-containing protein n=1 Tax=Leptothoe sp. PORK10 BA2 TaxID=3110254 RepID=UPI002B2100D0|nr:PDDEXK nuclease domain-containing protein [Leptothoe sp. PORK10 BA2]MEA5466483.1 PDDEXK nuclease domain-containing protein [Leptothoe sp. PORK10 BA2]
MANSLTPDNYRQFLQSLKDRIRSAQVKAALAVNQELILLYWQIGREILARQQQEGWGTKVIDRLAKDLKRDFPEMTGFSARNLKYMRAFADANPDGALVQQVFSQIPWGHNVRLLDVLKDPEERLWYARQTIANGWSRNVLLLQIEQGVHHQPGPSAAITNFERTLPPAQSDLAQNLIKDPYNFDFLTLAADAQDRDLETSLLNHIRDFLLELGVGFAFVGSQYPIQVGTKDYTLDLLFYHLKLRCFVVIDLKLGEFEPEFSGKMNFFVSAVDDLLRHPDDQPTIGMILCKSNDATVAEYSLRDVNKPIGVATHRLGRQLPADLQGTLPTVEELEQQLENAQVAGPNRAIEVGL